MIDAARNYLPRPRHPFTTWLVFWALQVLLHALFPVLVLFILWRARKEPGYRRGFSERLGLGPVGAPGAVWFFAASLGETRAASPLIRRLRAEGKPILLTHATPAGLEEGYRLFSDDPGVTHRYMPLDLVWAVALFLARARPALGVVMEIEIWPAMLFCARWAGVPMVLANGNLLKQSMGGGLRRHAMRLYQEFLHIFTRDADYRERYLKVGVAPDRISVVGELKYDQWIDPAHRAMAARLREGWGVERVILLASTVQQEEPLLLPVVKDLLRHDPGLGVLWVPRSPQRFEAVARLIAGAGLKVCRRSTLGPYMESPPHQGTQVIVGDSIGEMNAYYPMAELVFVGASLVDHGGHNIMEPMAFAKPVLMGPSIYGIAFAAGPATEAGAFQSLPDADALGRRCADLLANPVMLAQMSTAAAQYFASQSGAADRTHAKIMTLLGGV